VRRDHHGDQADGIAVLHHGHQRIASWPMQETASVAQRHRVLGLVLEKETYGHLQEAIGIAEEFTFHPRDRTSSERTTAVAALSVGAGHAIGPDPLVLTVIAPDHIGIQCGRSRGRRR
jgi:hypothetical protein